MIWGYKIHNNVIYDHINQGITLVGNVQNFDIRGNNITNCFNGGIFAVTSGSSPSTGNITENILTTNGDAPPNEHGVSLAAGCSNINVYMNDFIDNNGAQPLLQGNDGNLASNNWDNAYQKTIKNRGNYYKGWTGLVDANYDGIADNNYTIMGAGAKDTAPLMNSFIYYDISNIHVDDDYAISEPGFGATRFNQTQLGINAVDDNGTVNIYNGTYYGALVINNQSAYIYGEDVDGVIFDGNGASIIVTIDNSSEVYITQITIQNATVQGGILVNNSEYVWVENCIITDIAIGIYVQSSNNTRYNNNTIINMFSPTAMRTQYCNGIEIDNNTFYAGLETQDSTALLMENNIFLNGSGWLLQLYGSANVSQYDIKETNLVNGKPIYFIKNAQGINNAMDGIFDIGQLVLYNVNDSVFTGVSISDVTIGIMAYESKNINISHNNFANI